MWRRTLRIFLFVFSFTANVTVRAEVFTEPKGCHEAGSVPCSYFVRTHSEAYQWGSESIRLTKGTSFVRANDFDYRLVNGEALVETLEQITIGTVYGQVHLVKGRALIKVNNKRVEFYALSGTTKYQPRGEEKSSFLPVGFSNFIERVTLEGVAKSGYPKPAELEPLLDTWAAFFKKTETDELKYQVSEFREPWRAAVDQSGPWYIDTVNRQIAALEAERERQRRLRAERLKEENFFREMFRRRNLIE